MRHRTILTGGAMALGVFMLPAWANAGQKAKGIWTFDQSGYAPAAGLVVDKHGNLFGTTESGGTGPCDAKAGCGTVYELSPPPSGKGKWAYTVLYNFQGGADGGFPMTPLTVDDTTGTVYGYTQYKSSGTVFSLTPPAQSGSPWTFEVIYTFTGGADGSLLTGASPLLAPGGRVYGIANSGGHKGCGGAGCGTLFQLSPPRHGHKWTETTLFTFKGNKTGGLPNYIVGPDTNDAVYVSTSWHHGAVLQFQRGTAPHAHLTVLTQFTGGTDGSNPTSLVLGLNGDVYGLADLTRHANQAFQLAPPTGHGTTWTRTQLAQLSFHGYGATTLSFAYGGGLMGTVYGDPDFFPGEVFGMAQPTGGGPWNVGAIWRFAKGPDRNPLSVAVGRGPDVFDLFGVLSGGDSSNGTVYAVVPTE